MLLGVRTQFQIYIRHAIVASVAGIIAYIVWLLYDEWSPDMRLWKSLGSSAFALLWFTVFIGPASVLCKRLKSFVSWRRETGIWFAVTVFVHAYLILDGWIDWSVVSLFGFQYIADLDIYARSEPGFGLANMIGLLVVFFALILAATSSDRAVNYLGVSSWKWLHSFAYVIFYLTVLHVLYFAFIHYAPSPVKLMTGALIEYPANPLRFAYLSAFLSVFIVQVAGFIKIFRQNKQYNEEVHMPVAKFKTQIKEIKEIAKDTYEVSFVRPNDFLYKHGQYIQVSLSGGSLSAVDDSRVLSLTSDPGDKSVISVAFRNTMSGFKSALLSRKKGDSVIVEGPFGNFVFPGSDTRRHIFIAGGIGITPFMSILRCAGSGSCNVNYEMVLIYANRSEEFVSYKREIDELSNALSNLSVEYVTGRITEEVLRKFVDKSMQTVWWIVGPPGMVSAVKQMLVDIGIDYDYIRTEEFAGY